MGICLSLTRLILLQCWKSAEMLRPLPDVLAELGGKLIPEPWSPFVCKAADIAFDDRYAFRWMGHGVELFVNVN